MRKPTSSNVLPQRKTLWNRWGSNTQKYIISIKKLGIEFGQNPLKRSNFFRFLNFLRIFLKLANSSKFRFIELKFRAEMHQYWVMFDTKFCENQSSPLNFRRILIFLFFFIVTSNFINSMYPRSFLYEEAKIKQSTPSKKELCEIGEEAIWESRFTSFF